MKEFITSNGIRMAEGELFNWIKDNTVTLDISIGNMEKMHTFSYDTRKQILSLFEIGYGSDYCNDFYCETLLDAEKIVVGFAKANKCELLPINVKPEIVIGAKEPFLK